MTIRGLNYLGTRLTKFCLTNGYCPTVGGLLVHHANLWHPYIDNRVSRISSLLIKLQCCYGNGEISLTSTGVLHFVTLERVYAIPCGARSQRSLLKSYSNWLILRKGKYAELVDYAFEREKLAGWTIFSVEKLDKFSGSVHESEKVLELLKGKNVENQFANSTFEMDQKVLTDIAGIPHKDVAMLTVLPESGSIGVTHGDFHSGNLLRNKTGRVVLIDMDRLEFSSAQIFDRIHCAVVSREVERGRHWLSFFAIDTLMCSGSTMSKISYEVSSNSLVAYFLWRQSVELQSRSVPDRAYLKRLRTCFYRLLGYTRLTQALKHHC